MPRKVHSSSPLETMPFSPSPPPPPSPPSSPSSPSPSSPIPSFPSILRLQPHSPLFALLFPPLPRLSSPQPSPLSLCACLTTSRLSLCKLSPFSALPSLLYLIAPPFNHLLPSTISPLSLSQCACSTASRLSLCQLSPFSALPSPPILLCAFIPVGISRQPPLPLQKLLLKQLHPVVRPGPAAAGLPGPSLLSPQGIGTGAAGAEASSTEGAAGTSLPTSYMTTPSLSPTQDLAQRQRDYQAQVSSLRKAYAQEQQELQRKTLKAQQAHPSLPPFPLLPPHLLPPGLGPTPAGLPSPGVIPSQGIRAGTAGAAASSDEGAADAQRGCGEREGVACGGEAGGEGRPGGAGKGGAGESASSKGGSDEWGKKDMGDGPREEQQQRREAAASEKESHAEEKRAARAARAARAREEQESLRAAKQELKVMNAARLKEREEKINARKEAAKTALRMESARWIREDELEWRIMEAMSKPYIL
ncbi:unnamed protein product [Closterium sp. Naga37s-1]|nr:unnamed protein product [Closterium sp. Naga37s-1]CAI5533832.1 unnamed protein product [Closterium sp. Naga37s-1]